MVHMNKNDRALEPVVAIPQHILALSWNISTEPKLYQELASNPYSASSEKIISERFPDSNISDVRRAIILAEPEGRYGKDFNYLDPSAQTFETIRQDAVSTDMHARFVKYTTTHAEELALLPKALAYASLSMLVFEASDLKEIELRYAQNQRRKFRLLIYAFIDDNSSTLVVKKHLTFQNPIFKVSSFAFICILLFLAVNTFYIQEIKPDTPRSIQRTDVQSRITSENGSPTSPKRLIIPRIDVNAAVEDVGITLRGAMGIPESTIDVGWFNHGPRPGENGSAVIAGHLNGELGEAGVFADLHKLKAGDKLYIEDSRGESIAFVVREHRQYDPGYADDVFRASDSAHLNLITCDGIWNELQKGYSKRLVVFADIVR